MRFVSSGRALVAALALGGALAVPAAPAAAATSCPTGDPCIAVHLQSGTQYVTASQITAQATAAADADAANAVQDVQYLYSVSAGTGPFVGIGLSVNALLENLLGPNGFGQVTFTELTRPIDGSESILQSGAGDLSAPSGFLDGQLPVFWVNGSEIDYTRPLRNDSDNAATDDAIQSDQGGALDLYVHTGPLLTVTAHASATTIKADQTVTFTASSSGDSVPPTYRWTLFGSPHRFAVGQRVTHIFATSGLYEVLLSAAGSDDSAGSAEPLFITVGTALTSSPSQSPSPGSSGSRTPSSSPDPTATAHPTSTSTGQGSGAPSGSPHPGASATDGSGPTPSAGVSGSVRPTPSADPGQLPVVSGRLVGEGVALLISPGAPSVQTQGGGVSAAPLSTGWRVTTATGSVLAIMLLFGLGAARELRWSRTGSKTWVRRH